MRHSRLLSRSRMGYSNMGKLFLQDLSPSSILYRTLYFGPEGIKFVALIEPLPIPHCLWQGKNLKTLHKGEGYKLVRGIW